MVQHDPPDQVEIDGLRTGDRFQYSGPQNWIGVIGLIVCVIGFGLFIFAFIGPAIVPPNSSFSFLLTKDADAICFCGGPILALAGYIMMYSGY
jgi:hypothetical protein